MSTEPSSGYQMDPAKPALWLRLLVGSRPFPVQSWRGHLLIRTAGLNMALIGLAWFWLYTSWSRGHAVTTSTLAQRGLAILVTTGLWWLSRPTQRVTVASPLNELYGQLRTMPAPGRKLKSREFAVVRHWGHVHDLLGRAGSGSRTGRVSGPTVWSLP